MDRRRMLVVLVAVGMACSLVPVSGAMAESPADAAAGHSTAGVDASITDRFRYGTASSGLAREDTENVLEQPTRERVYDSIRESPGIGLERLVETTAVTKSTVRYHTRILRSAGLIDSTTVAGTLRFAPAEVDVDVAGVLGVDATRTVLEAVAEHEPASVATVAEATDRAPSTVSHHLSALEERGVVDRERAGEAVVTRLTDRTRSVIGSLDRPTAADD